MSNDDEREPRYECPRHGAAEKGASFPCYFGCCPECDSAPPDGWPCLNVGRTHWFFCETHKLRWWEGADLFSAWRDEDEETWRSNAEFLSQFKVASEG